MNAGVREGGIEVMMGFDMAVLVRVKRVMIGVLGSILFEVGGFA